MKTIYLVISVIAISLIIIVGIFYIALKTKTKDVTNELPFTTFINKNLVLERDVLLLKINDSGFFDRISEIIEIGSWKDVQWKDTEGWNKLLIKKGTTLTIKNVTLKASGVSGIPFTQISGVLHTQATDIEFYHTWGEYNTALFDEDGLTIAENFFKFSKPIWECQFDENKIYFLPIF